jgi:hypothetical protein
LESTTVKSRQICEEGRGIILLIVALLRKDFFARSVKLQAVSSQEIVRCNVEFSSKQSRSGTGVPPLRITRKMRVLPQTVLVENVV